MNKTEKKFVEAWHRCHSRFQLWEVYILISYYELKNRIRGWFMTRPQLRALLISAVVIVATAVWIFADQLELTPRANILLGALITFSVVAILVIWFMPFDGGGDNGAE